MAAKDIKEKVLWVIEERINEKSGGGTDLRIVQWLIDGKAQKPGLEKREWYLDEQGNRKIGKAKAFNSYDLAKVIINIKRIAAMVELKEDRLDEALQLAMFQDRTAPAPNPVGASSTPRASQPQSAAGGAPPPQTF